MRRVRQRKFDPDDADWPQRLSSAAIPARYWPASIEAIKDGGVKSWVSGAVSGAQSWMSSGRGFFLHGPLNSGKSSIASILAQDAISRVERVVWIPARDIPSVMWRTSDRCASLYERLVAADLVVFDDLGAESQGAGGKASSAFESALRVPYDRQRSVIVTSNLNWRDFIAVYGTNTMPLVSVLSRMVEPVAVVNEQWGGEVIERRG